MPIPRTLVGHISTQTLRPEHRSSMTSSIMIPDGTFATDSYQAPDDMPFVDPAAAVIRDLFVFKEPW